MFNSISAGARVAAAIAATTIAGAAFAQSGEGVSASIVTDRETGRSRGFGFVEMGDADADGAISMWNGKEFGGRMLTVSDARPKA